MKRHSGNIFTAFSLLCLFLQSQQIDARTDQNDHYIAAVVEYASEYDRNPQKTMEMNLVNYMDFIKEAKRQDADIIVFPEDGLSTIRMPAKPSDAIKFTSVIPDPKGKVVPCTPNSIPGQTSKILEQLSCEAKANKIYVVVNLAERYPKPNKKDDFLLYNTNIVLDRNGAIIARYRKYNLFGEIAFNKTETPELVTFDTDFGVTFGTFICFDILFAEPASRLLREKKVTDVVYPTAWFSSLPFLTAVQVQAGWARANKVNLLAAGYNNPEGYSGGSGIFSGTNGIADYVIPVSKHSQLLVSRVSKIKSNGIQFKDVTKRTECQHGLGNVEYLHTMQEDFSKYTTKVLKGDVSQTALCHDDFCCTFTVKFAKQDSSSVTHMMTAYRGLRRFVTEWNTVEICAIVICANANKDSCGLRLDGVVDSTVFNELSIQGEFDKDDRFVHIPSAVLYRLDPLPYHKYSYKSEPQKRNKAIEMKATGVVSDILGFGVYGIKKNPPASQ